jgi:DNA repair protein RadD
MSRIINLRPYQQELKTAVLYEWQNSAKNVVMQLATGGGKTAILSSIIRDHTGASCVIAHRQEILGQLSTALARNGVRHDLIAAQDVKRSIARGHVADVGASFYCPGAPCVVASVDTLVKRADPAWAKRVELWVVDEGHHVVTGNKWRTATELFPNARGLLPTATPCRADGKGLGHHADGVADAMVQGPPMRWLIDQGYLSDYRIVCPTSDMVVLGDVAKSGDWSAKQLIEASERSHVIGDVVSSYLKWARGMRGITFATDVKTAGRMVIEYVAAGVRAELITGETDGTVRRAHIRGLESGQLDMIVAVDIVSEGFDLPALDCLVMARPTASLNLYMQQFGRGLRISPGKDKALVIDLVANVIRHGGPPDRERVWTLDRRGKRASGASEGIPLTVCVECFQPFERVLRACPHCGHYEPPATRAAPKFVDGDLAELSPEILAQLRGAVAAVDLPLEHKRAEIMATGWSYPVQGAHIKHHALRLDAQQVLRSSMAEWAGPWHLRGHDDSQIQRRFYHIFGISVIEAMVLNAKDATALDTRVRAG